MAAKKKTQPERMQTVRSAEGRAIEKARNMNKVPAKTQPKSSSTSLRARGVETGSVRAPVRKPRTSSGPTVRSTEGRAIEKARNMNKVGPARQTGGFGKTKPRSSGSSLRATGAEAKVGRGSRAGSSLRARGVEKGSVRTPGYTTRGGNTGGFGKTAYKARGNAQTVRSAEGRAKEKASKMFSEPKAKKKK